MNYTDARSKDPVLYDKLLQEVIDKGFYETELLSEADSIYTGLIERGYEVETEVLENKLRVIVLNYIGK